MLGRFLSRGLAGERNPMVARLWLERAAAHGIQEAADGLAEFASD
jgi:TPR repeat protein